MVEYAVKFFEHLREAIYRRALLEYVESARSENKKQNKTKQNKMVYSSKSAWLHVSSTFLRARGWRGRVLAAGASPRLRMLPSSTAIGDQHDTKYVTFE